MFDVDDLLAGDNSTARTVAGGVGVVIRALLAMTTAGFFWIYGARLFEWAVGYEYGAWLSAAVGVFLLDGMAAIWPRLREKAANTSAQMNAAGAGALGCLAASVVVTLVFVILQTTFVATVDAAGQLTAVGQVVNITGLVVMTGAIVGNGILIAYYESNGAESRKAQHAAELRALATRGQFEVERGQAQLVIARTLDDIGAAMPTAAQTAGRRNAERYIAGQFGHPPAPAGQPWRVTPAEMQANLDEAGHGVNGQSARPTSGR
jgi:hypothetical protein